MDTAPGVSLRGPDPPQTALLLTGRPGIGKTTIIKAVAARLPGRVGGFYTEEIRQGGQRKGFALVTLNGQRATLAHVEIRGPYRVSKYGVDVAGLEETGVGAIREASRSCNYVVIDEIGKMELFSPAFREAVLEAIEGGKRVLGSILLASHPFANGLKKHPRVRLIPVTESNRASLVGELLRQLVG
jgi:nucleoside-triphosphatase